MASVALSSSLVAGPESILRVGVADVAIAAGQVVYINTNGRLRLADADASPATAEAVGIALNGAAAGQPVTYLVEGSLTGLATMKVGQHYLLSNTPGSVSEAAVADITEDVTFVTFIGIATSTTTMKIKILASGVALNLV